MRLSKYLALSTNDNNTSLFRSLSINLVDKDTNNIDIVNQLDYITEDVAHLLDKANKQLKTVYRGKMKFDLCTEQEGNTPDVVKMNESNREKVKSLWYELNNDLCEIQYSFESYINSIK